MAAILAFQNNKTAAMLLYQTNPVRLQLFSYVNAFFCSFVPINLHDSLTREHIALLIDNKLRSLEKVSPEFVLEMIEKRQLQNLYSD